MPKRPKQVEGVYEKNPGSGVWYTRLRVNGRLVRKAIGTHSEAIAYVEKARTLRRTSEGVGQTAVRSFAEIEKVDSGTTINELCDLYLGHIQNPANPERLRDQGGPPSRIKAIRKAFGDRPAAPLKPYEIKDWLIAIQREPGSLNRYKSTLSVIFRYAKERELVATNPVREVQHFKVIDKNPATWRTRRKPSFEPWFRGGSIARRSTTCSPASICASTSTRSPWALTQGCARATSTTCAGQCLTSSIDSFICHGRSQDLRIPSL